MPLSGTRLRPSTTNFRGTKTYSVNHWQPIGRPDVEPELPPLELKQVWRYLDRFGKADDDGAERAERHVGCEEGFGSVALHMTKTFGDKEHELITTD
jgi:hypothetical protein